MSLLTPANSAYGPYSGLDALFDLQIAPDPTCHNCDKPRLAVTYRYAGLRRVLLLRTPLCSVPRPGAPVPIVRFNGKPYYDLAGQFVPAHLLLKTLKTGDPSYLDIENWPGYVELSENQRLILLGHLNGAKGSDIMRELGVSQAYASTKGANDISAKLPFDLKRWKAFIGQWFDSMKAGIKAADDYMRDRTFLRNPGVIPKPYTPKVGGLVTEEDRRFVEYFVETARRRAAREGQRCHLNPLIFLPLTRLCSVTRRQFHWHYNPPVLVRYEFGPYTHDNVALVDRTAADSMSDSTDHIELPEHLRDAAHPHAQDLSQL